MDKDVTLDVALPKTAELDKLGTEVDTDGGGANTGGETFKPLVLEDEEEYRCCC